MARCEHRSIAVTYKQPGPCSRSTSQAKQVDRLRFCGWADSLPRSPGCQNTERETVPVSYGVLASSVTLVARAAVPRSMTYFAPGPSLICSAGRNDVRPPSGRRATQSDFYQHVQLAQLPFCSSASARVWQAYSGSSRHAQSMQSARTVTTQLASFVLPPWPDRNRPTGVRSVSAHVLRVDC